MLDGLVGLLQDGPISGLDVVENRISFVRGFVIWLVGLWVEVLVSWSMGFWFSDSIIWWGGKSLGLLNGRQPFGWSFGRVVGSFNFSVCHYGFCWVVGQSVVWAVIVSVSESFRWFVVGMIGLLVVNKFCV